MADSAHLSEVMSARERVVAVHRRTEIVFQDALNAMIGAIEDLGATESSLTGLAATLSPEAMLRLRSCQSQFEDLGAELRSKAERSQMATRRLQDLMRRTLDSLDDLRRLSRTATLVSLNAVVVSRTLGADGATIDSLAREMRVVLEDVGRLVAELGAKVALGRAGLDKVEVLASALEQVTHDEALPNIRVFADLLAGRSRDRRIARSAGLVSKRFRSLQDRVSEVVLHLQGGDSFRQRLEHAAAILAMAAEPDLPMPGDRLLRLAADQIRGALDDLRKSIRCASRHLRTLAYMASEIPRASAIGLLRGGDDGGLAPMIAGAARIHRVVTDLSGLGERLRVATRDLSATLVEAGQEASTATQFERLMTVMGLNAILLSSRLGTQGRAMEEVASQQHDIARSLIDAMRGLRRHIEEVVSLVALLEGEDDEVLFRHLQQATRNANDVTALTEQVSTHLSVTRAVRSADALETMMSEAALALDAFLEMASGLDDVVLAFDRGSAGQDPLTPAAHELLESIRTSYTMKAERQIHDRHVPRAQTVHGLPPEKWSSLK